MILELPDLGWGIPHLTSFKPGQVLDQDLDTEGEKAPVLGLTTPTCPTCPIKITEHG